MRVSTKHDKDKESEVVLSLNSRKATIRTYNAAIDACELAWQKALLLFDEVSEVSLQKSIITYNSTANACVKEEQWQLALSLLDKLPEARIPSLVLIEFAVPNLLWQGISE